MESEWIECTLADVCSSIDYGLTASATVHNTGLKFLRITDIVSGHIDWGNVPYVDADSRAAAKYRLYDGDIVIARTGASTGSSIYVMNPLPAVFASYLVRLKVRPEFDPRFVAYYLWSDQFWTFIRGVLGDKSAQPNASASTMTGAPFRAPKKKGEQHAIARILSSLDDKIELNRKMNATLEAMAQALFRSWFVDFDPVRAKVEGRAPAGMDEETAALFPDGFEVVDGREVPVGWEVSTVGSVIDLAYGKALKEDVRRPGNIPVYGSNGQVGWHDEYLVNGPGIIVGRKGNPGVVTWSQTDFFPIDTTFYVVPKKKSMCLSYLFYELKSQNLAFQRSDSAVPGLNRNIAYLNHTIVPSEAIINRFDNTVQSLFELIYSNINQSRTLAALRDTLLPKLISGEVRVPVDEKEKAII